MKEDPPDPTARRALWHDLRGVLAAAHANVEFIGAAAIPEELRPVLEEIEHELRLVSDVIAQLGARDASRTVDVDLRALLWFAARSGARTRIDPTARPFLVHGRASDVAALVDAIVAAVAPGAVGTLDTEQATCTVHGLDGDAAHAAVAAAKAVGLGANVKGDALILKNLREPGAKRSE
ncbi:MAG: hypothetical protein HYV09_21365 [Deltaproteobacteria bacterium]|nr:hypothetical protein [Deltaproteobacteria bacterium]